MQTESLQNKSPGYGTKPFDGETPVLEIWRMWSNPLIAINL